MADTFKVVSRWSESDIDEPVPSLGKMVSTSLDYVRVYWHMGLFPSLMIAIITMGFTFMGDGLRDALDPTMNRES